MRFWCAATASLMRGLHSLLGAVIRMHAMAATQTKSTRLVQPHNQSAHRQSWAGQIYLSVV